MIRYEIITAENGDRYFDFEPLRPDIPVNRFDCSIGEYNEYLTREALRSQNDHIALTWLMRDRVGGGIAGYMALVADAIKLSVSEKELHNLNYPFKTVPAMKIAKLAVSSAYRGQYKGLGSFMITAAIALAITCNKTLFACRFLTVDADVERNESVRMFYEKNGFFVNEALFNKKRKNISMRRDIYFQGMRNEG
jgi:ribosomal protein S18 acetylase RimI-like enzyme